MQNVTLRMEDDLVESLDAEADDRDLSRSEYIRNILASRHDESALQRKNDQLQAQVDDLRSQLQATNQRIETTNELVEYVEEQRLAENRAEQRRHANVLRRSWWWLTGVPEEDEDD